MSNFWQNIGDNSTADRIVYGSTDGTFLPQTDYGLLAVGLGGEREPSGAYRFPDGSAISLTRDGLPLRFMGG